MSFRNWLQAQNKRSSKSRRQSTDAQRRRSRPYLERLEDRIQPTLITVTGNLDGPGVLTQGMQGQFFDTTLRGAINAADADHTSDVQIDFDPAFFIFGSQPISVASSLPPITRDHVKVDDNDVPVILDGTNAGDLAIGLQITAPDCQVSALAIENFKGSGIDLSGPDAQGDSILVPLITRNTVAGDQGHKDTVPLRVRA